MQSSVLLATEGKRSMLRSGERQRADFRSRIHSLALAATTNGCFLRAESARLPTDRARRRLGEVGQSVLQATALADAWPSSWEQIEFGHSPKPTGKMPVPRGGDPTGGRRPALQFPAQPKTVSC
jgi:hypothetical protein